MNFRLLTNLSQNKASVGDTCILDGAERTVVKISKQYVYLDDKSYYPKNQFNRWVRMHQHQQNHKTAIKNRTNDFNRMVKAWQEGFKRASFTPRNTFFSYVLYAKNPVRTYGDDYLIYFATNEHIDVVDLVTEFAKEKVIQASHVESAGKYLTLPYKDKDDNVIIVLFPHKELSQTVIDSWNEHNPGYKLVLKKN